MRQDDRAGSSSAVNHAFVLYSIQVTEYFKMRNWRAVDIARARRRHGKAPSVGRRPPSVDSARETDARRRRHAAHCDDRALCLCVSRRKPYTYLHHTITQQPIATRPSTYNQCETYTLIAREIVRLLTTRSVFTFARWHWMLFPNRTAVAHGARDVNTNMCYAQMVRIQFKTVRVVSTHSTIICALSYGFINQIV